MAGDLVVAGELAAVVQDGTVTIGSEDSQTIVIGVGTTGDIVLRGDRMVAEEDVTGTAVGIGDRKTLSKIDLSKIVVKRSLTGPLF